MSLKYSIKGELRIEEYGQSGEDDYQIAEPTTAIIERQYHEGKMDKLGGRTLHLDVWNIRSPKLGQGVTSHDFDKALEDFLGVIDQAIADGEIPYQDDQK